MKLYIQIIQTIQNYLIRASIIFLLIFPTIFGLFPEKFSDNFILGLYTLSHVFLFCVMVIRPLADIVTEIRYIRPLVPLRKSFGIASASIIVAFILTKMIIDPIGYISGFGNGSYWSLENLSLLAHTADITAIILLITSNNLSKRLLGQWWKRIQKLSYVYFYASSIYVFVKFEDERLAWAMAIVTVVTSIAYIVKKKKTIRQ